jgi:cellulose synthase (UDP-forming)
MIFALTLGGLFFTPATDIVFDRDAGDGKWVILAWTIYNLVVLAVAMAVCVELPRAGAAPRIEPERVVLHAQGRDGSAWLMRLTAGDAWLRGGPFLAAGETLEVAIEGVGRVRAEVTRVEPSGSALRLHPDEAQRTALLVKLHTRIGAAGTTQTDMGGLVADIVLRAGRRGAGG